MSIASCPVNPSPIVSAELASATIDLIEPRLRAAFAADRRRPFVVGLCGAQGSGKSTVAERLMARLESTGLKVALLSLDDLYLPREDRAALAASVHPLLATRGVPGTHDVALGEAVLAALGRDGVVALPRFSKPDDTRCPQAAWPLVAAPVDIVLFEGWCVGARPQEAAALAQPVNALEAEEDRDGAWRRWVNDRLGGDYRRLFAAVDWLVLLAAPGFAIVSAWRKEQEHKLRAALAAEGKGLAATLDDAGVDRFIQFYQRITEHILTEMPARADLCLSLDAQRNPVLREREKG
jgi:D-glycerate 3-kinase